MIWAWVSILLQVELVYSNKAGPKGLMHIMCVCEPLSPFLPVSGPLLGGRIRPARTRAKARTHAHIQHGLDLLGLHVVTEQATLRRFNEAFKIL